MERTLPKLSKDDIRLLHPKIQLGRAEAGKVLVRHGAPPLGLFIVRTGGVEVQRHVHGFPRAVATLGVDEMFGESAFLSAPPPPATATIIASEPTEVIVLTPQRLAPLFAEHPGLFSRFFHSIAIVLSRRLRHFNQQTGGPTKDRFGSLPSWEIL